MKKNWAYHCALLILSFLIAYTFSIRFFEPSGETWRNWASAQIFFNEGKFLVLSVGPLYTLYLLPFLKLGYPTGPIVEHFTTLSLFGFFLLKFFNSRVPIVISVLLTAIWVSFASVINPTGMIFGHIFLIRYFTKTDRKLVLLPWELVAALLSHSSGAAYLFGHLAGVAWSYFKKHQKEIKPIQLFQPASFALLMFLGATFILQVQSPYNNHLFMAQKYVPIDVKSSPVKIGFFQIFLYENSRDTVSKENQIEEDWFLTYPKLFTPNQSLISAVFAHPKLTYKHVHYHARNFISWLSFFSFGYFDFNISILSHIYHLLMVTLFGFGIYFGLKKENLWLILPQATAAISAYLFVGLALMLTWVTDRYYFGIMPAGVFLAVLWIKSIGSFVGRRYSRSLTIGLFSVCFLLLLNHIPLAHHWKTQIYAVLNQEGILEKHADASMSFRGGVEDQLKKISQSHIILTDQPAWILAFSAVHLNNIREVFDLAPFQNDETSLLKQVDEFWISNETLVEAAAVSTQLYLRYRLHLRDYFENLNPNYWEKINIPSFGLIVRKKK